MIFRSHISLFFSAVAGLSLQKMPRLEPKSLFQNSELILWPLLNISLILEKHLVMHQFIAQIQGEMQVGNTCIGCVSILTPVATSSPG